MPRFKPPFYKQETDSSCLLVFEQAWSSTEYLTIIIEYYDY